MINLRQFDECLISSVLMSAGAQVAWIAEGSHQVIVA
jgi:hypothetical protein